MKPRSSTIPTPVYKAFPHRYTPFKDDVLRWAQEGAYFILCGEGSTKRMLHRGCTRELSAKMKAEMHKFIEQEYPIIMLDLSPCPVLLEEHEWIHAITGVDPSYVNCTCSFMRYMVEEVEVPRQCFRLEMPCYYLCNMNNNGQHIGEYASLPHEELYRLEQVKKQQSLVLDSQSRRARHL